LLAGRWHRITRSGTTDAKGEVRLFVTAIANHKGGVGKTTTAVNHAACLARDEGQRTLLVDADAQAHATYFYVDDVTAVQADLQDVMVKQVPAEKVIVRTRIEGLDLLPATLSLAVLDMQMVAMARREEQVKRALSSLEGRYDHVIIDLPPNLAPLTLAALVAATHIVVPVNASRLALQGLGTFIGWTEHYRDLEVIEAQVLGVLLTMYSRNTRISEETRQGLEEAQRNGELPVFDTVIPRRVGVEDDAADRLVAGDARSHRDLTAAYQAFSAECVAKLGAGDARH
jgi:chromosome partitioning protein